MRLKHITFLLFLAVSFQSTAQITEDKIAGTWKVGNIKTDFTKYPAEKKQELEAMVGIIKQSTIEFLKDGNFNWNSPFEMMQVKGKHWKFFPSANKIVVSDWKDPKHTYMEFLVKEISGSIQLIKNEGVIEIEFQKIK